MANPTLLDYRRRAAKELGAFLASTADTSSTVSQLVDLAWPINSSLSQDDLYADFFLFRPNAVLAADKVRIAKTYTPSGGQIQPDLNWTNKPAAAEVYELHGIIEPLTALPDLINEALKRCFIEVEFTLSPTSVTAQRHSLAAAASWLTDPNWVRSVGRLSQGVVRTDRDPYEWLVRGSAFKDSGVVYLDHPGQGFVTTDTLYVKAIKPAYNDCTTAATSFGNTSGIATSTTTGLWTVTVTSTAGLSAGMRVAISGAVPTAYNGTWLVNTVPNGTTFTIASYAAPGTVATQGAVSAVTVQNGLSLETDQCVADPRWVAWGTIVEAWRSYGQLLETGAKGRLSANRAEAAAMFTRLTDLNFTLPPLTFRSLRRGGPIQSRQAGAYRATTA